MFYEKNKNIFNIFVLILSVAVNVNASENSILVEEWDISATEEDKVVAKLYSDNTFTISGSGNVKDYETLGGNPWEEKGITKVIIEEGVNNIENCMFRYCKDLKNIVISESVCSIGDNAFDNCNNLIEINIPNSVMEIVLCAFRGCTRLTSIIIPENITRIENHTFAMCNTLNNITLPDGLQYIGI